MSDWRLAHYRTHSSLLNARTSADCSSRLSRGRSVDLPVTRVCEPEPLPGKSRLSEREPTTTVGARCAWKTLGRKQGLGREKKKSRTGVNGERNETKRNETKRNETGGKRKRSKGARKVGKAVCLRGCRNARPVASQCVLARRAISNALVTATRVETDGHRQRLCPRSLPTPPLCLPPPPPHFTSSSSSISSSSSSFSTSPFSATVTTPFSPCLHPIPALPPYPSLSFFLSSYLREMVRGRAPAVPIPVFPCPNSVAYRCLYACVPVPISIPMPVHHPLSSHSSSHCPAIAHPYVATVFHPRFPFSILFRTPSRLSSFCHLA